MSGVRGTKAATEGGRFVTRVRAAVSITSLAGVGDTEVKVTWTTSPNTRVTAARLVAVVRTTSPQYSHLEISSVARAEH